jgi:hypothetical protein
MPGIWRLAALAALAGLALGWGGYTRLAEADHTQPVRFSHLAHARQGAACANCHFNGPGQSFSGLPSIGVCASCHAEPTGARTEDGRERDKLVAGYVKRGRNVPWLVSARQPDHVLFVHAPHLNLGCESCHPAMARDEGSAVRVNRVSGQAARAMSMERCRSCHVKDNAASDCAACHR